MNGPLPSRPAPGRAEQDQGGFATVDALVALVILATTLAWALTGLDIAAKTSRKAEEVARVTEIARHLLIASAAGSVEATGASGSFRWRFTDSDATSASRTCLRSLVLKNLQTGHAFHFTGASPCG